MPTNPPEKKLDPLRDGYQIAVIGENHAYSISCSPQDDPVNLDTVPKNIRADYEYHGFPVMRSDISYPQLEFVAGNYYYSLNAWGSVLPKDTMDTLLNITDNILQQAG